MTTVKYYAEIDNPYVNLAYIVDSAIQVPLQGGSGPSSSQIEAWVAEGNTISPAFTQEEIDEYNGVVTYSVQSSMVTEGEALKAEDANRIDVGATPVISDPVVYDAWLLDLYNEQDINGLDLPKPPETERQLLSIYDEDRDKYEFTRYQDQWGWRWYLSLQRESVNALAIAIYDINGNYLYTTGAMLSDGQGGWYTECPAGQADAVPEDVYFKWLLGSANISDLENYKGIDINKKGFVRSDERYD